MKLDAITSESDGKIIQVQVAPGPWGVMISSGEMFFTAPAEQFALAIIRTAAEAGNSKLEKWLAALIKA